MQILSPFLSKSVVHCAKTPKKNANAPLHIWHLGETFALASAVEVLLSANDFFVLNVLLIIS